MGGKVGGDNVSSICTLVAVVAYREASLLSCSCIGREGASDGRLELSEVIGGFSASTDASTVVRGGGGT